MTFRRRSLFREALGLMSFGLVLKQIGLGLLVFLLAVLWLRMPDASVLEVIGSVVLGLAVLGVAGAGESVIVLHLSAAPRSAGRLVRGTVLLLAGTALWFGWTMLLNHFGAKEYLWAGYLNSRFPPSLRNVFSYSRLDLWITWIWAALEWMGAGVIAAFVVPSLAANRPLRAIVRCLRSISYWLTLIVAATAAASLTSALAQWTPGHGLRVEMLSLVLRLGFVVIADALAVCLLLAMIAACVRRANAAYSTPAGTPEESQPRTAAIP